MKKTQRSHLPLALLIGCIMLVFMSSCCSASSEIGKERAVVIAKNEALSRGWKEVEVGEARLIDGQWQVMVWRLPKVPGGLALVKISSNGKTIRFIHGK
jgi:hypothetical protein